MMDKDATRKIIDELRHNLSSPLKQIIGRGRMNKIGYFQVRKATEWYAKSLGLDYSCITLATDLEKRKVTANIVEHKNDPIIRYEFFLESITLTIVTE